MAAALDCVLSLCVEAEASENNVVIPLSISIADNLFHLHRGYIADFRSDTHCDAAIPLVVIRPISFSMDERSTSYRVQPAEFNVLVVWEINATRFQQANNLVEVRFCVRDRHLSIKRL